MYKSQDRSGHETYTKGQRRYRRRLGKAEPDEAPGGYMAGFSGVKRTREPSPLVDADPSERIKDMDHEGVDVHLTLPSGWFGTWTAGDDVVLEMAMYRAYHRMRSGSIHVLPFEDARLVYRLPCVRFATLVARTAQATDLGIRYSRGPGECRIKDIQQKVRGVSAS